MNESANPIVFFLDATDARRAAIPVWLWAAGIQSRTYATIDAFLADYKPERVGCVVLGSVSPTMDNRDFYDAAAARQIDLPVVAIVEAGNVPATVHALKSGAVEIIEEPLLHGALLVAVKKAAGEAVRRRQRNSARLEFTTCLERLSKREHEVLDCILTGRTNKELAQHLGISRRTADFHRANILRKLKADSVWHVVSMVLSTRS